MCCSVVGPCCLPLLSHFLYYWYWNVFEDFWVVISAFHQWWVVMVSGKGVCCIDYSFTYLLLVDMLIRFGFDEILSRWMHGIVCLHCYSFNFLTWKQKCRNSEELIKLFDLDLVHDLRSNKIMHAKISNGHKFTAHSSSHLTRER